VAGSLAASQLCKQIDWGFVIFSWLRLRLAGPIYDEEAFFWISLHDFEVLKILLNATGT
jgi:hypothetical protein